MSSMSHTQIEATRDTVENTQKEIESLTEQISRVSGVADQIDAIARQRHDRGSGRSVTLEQVY